MKKITHVEIYYEDSSMEKICNEERTDKKLTKKQIQWIIDSALCELNNFKTCYAKTFGPVTIINYKEFEEDDFQDLPHSEYQMMIYLLDSLK